MWSAGSSNSRLRRLVARWWPVLVTVAVLAFALWYDAALHGFTRLSDFISIGRRAAGPFGVLPLATAGPIGYDGQWYYFIARFPDRVPTSAFEWPALYYSRIVYPLFVRTLSLGQPALMPLMMLAINVAAVAATVALLAAVPRQRGLPQWPALVGGLYCGQPLAVMRDLTDPLFVFWLVLAFYGISRRRWILAAAALGLGMLTREATLPFALCCAVPLAAQRRWRTLAAFGCIVLMPYAAWEIVLHHWLGIWGFRQSSRVNVIAPFPFAGLAEAHTFLIFSFVVAFACVPAVLAIACAGARVWAEWRSATSLPAFLAGDPLTLAAALSCLVYGTLFVLQPGMHWDNIWEPPRLAAPLVGLVPLLLPPNGARRRWYLAQAFLAGTAILILAL